MAHPLLLYVNKGMRVHSISHVKGIVSYTMGVTTQVSPFGKGGLRGIS